MPTAKIAITVSEQILLKLDRLVKERRYPNRSRAIQEALEEKISRLESNRLAEALQCIDSVAEKLDAEEGMLDVVDTWPTY